MSIYLKEPEANNSESVTLTPSEIETAIENILPDLEGYASSLSTAVITFLTNILNINFNEDNKIYK
ncbi:MAG: hypothetical protein LBP22_07775 [Deltaproteobacteria bacterium]|jgi:hypothetical protein|nr:hypothetical protein [Deltaproteobacteria bacterium]